MSGRGFPKALVSARLDPAESSPRTVPGGAESGGHGSYEIQHLPAGSYTLRLFGEGLETTERPSIRVEDGKTTEGVDFVLKVGHLLGRVVDDLETPVPGAEVEAVSDGVGNMTTSRGKTDPEGHFSLDWAGEREFNLRAEAKGHETARLLGRDPGKEYVLTLRRSAVIAGRVRATGLDAFPRFQVRAFALDPSMRKRMQGAVQGEVQGKVAEDGTFDVEVAAGPWALTAIVPGFAPGISGEINVGIGERREGVVIDAPKGGTMDGRVLLKGTRKPVKEALVSFRVAERKYSGLPEARTDSEGKFTLAGLPEGTLHFAITYFNRSVKFLPAVALRAGERKRLEVEIDATGGIRGTLRKGGQEAGGGYVSFAKEDATDQVKITKQADPQGRFEIPGLPPGEYQLTSGGIRKTVKVLEEEYTEVEIILDG
jgi:hypothetical protein